MHRSVNMNLRYCQKDQINTKDSWLQTIYNAIYSQAPRLKNKHYTYIPIAFITLSQISFSTKTIKRIFFSLWFESFCSFFLFIPGTSLSSRLFPRIRHPLFLLTSNTSLSQDCCQGFGIQFFIDFLFSCTMRNYKAIWGIIIQYSIYIKHLKIKPYASINIACLLNSSEKLYVMYQIT